MSKSSASTPAVVSGRSPTQQASEIEAPARARRRDALLWFLANPPREVADAARALRDAEKLYGDETERELADLEVGQHPLQRTKAYPPTG